MRRESCIQDASIVELLGGHLVIERPPDMTTIRWQRLTSSIISDDTTITARPPPQLVDETIDFGFRADIDTTRRFVKMRTSRSTAPTCRSPASAGCRPIGGRRSAEIAAKLQTAGDVASRRGDAPPDTTPKGYGA
jgi:hypothetical protein